MISIPAPTFAVWLPGKGLASKGNGCFRLSVSVLRSVMLDSLEMPLPSFRLSGD
jgi:hypothetical protein